MAKKQAGRRVMSTARVPGVSHAPLRNRRATQTVSPVALKGSPPEANGQGSSFPIVGIGASAGGLEAFTDLLSHLPNDTGMAFVLIQHLDPKHESHLTELLSKASKMPISELKGDTRA